MSDFTTIRAVGSALPADVLSAVIGIDGLKGLTTDDYRLEIGLSPREAANRAWAVLTGAYSGFRDTVDKLPATDKAVGLTRDKWLMIVLRELGFGRVPTTPAGGLAADDRQFPVSHQYITDAGDVPVHLLGWGVELDKKTPGTPGAADRAPHAMVQEFLNRNGQSLWGILSNGRKLRLLRDSSTLIGQSFVEFDLEAMFEGEMFSDFVVLFLVCHATRFDTKNLDNPDTDPTPADCWLERWRTHAAETGTRALTGLRPAVAKAIEALGTGFVRHPANDFHRRLANREITPDDLHHALLRLVYRLLFCFVAEDRGLLLDSNSTPEARQRYSTWFSTARLRRVASRRHGSGHADLWQSLRIVLDALGTESGRPELGIPGLGGIFELGESDVVAPAELSNAALLEAMRHLTIVQPTGGGPKRRVDYRNLGAEELGSVYESLLEFVPRYDESLKEFTLETVVGNERKTSGAYYTPSSLIDCLLDSALDPLLDDAEKADDPEAALLALTVCDPACGSGHFLVAAAKRIAARLAAVRARTEGADETTPIDQQVAMHDVVDRCIYGVDLNPLAAELAKVSLWLESVQPGRALSFLDAHIKVGNALLGTTPALLTAGIPDDAFTALDGDDKKTVTSLRKRNKEEGKQGQGDLFSAAGVSVTNARFGEGAGEIDRLPATSLADVHLAAQRHREFDASPDLRRARLVADSWCAAFVAPKTPTSPAITQATLLRLANGSLADDSLEAQLVRSVSDEYKFFHWHLEFPQIFRAIDASAPADADGPGWDGGFSCVLGNPPWERIKLQEQEFFAAADPDIAEAPNAAARKKLIASLSERNPHLHAYYLAAKRRADGESQLIRLSGRYPLCGRGDINTYAIFAEHDRNIVGPIGRLGVILPAGIATDATTAAFFKSVVSTGSLSSLYHFENESRIFPGVHHAFRFCLLTLGGSGTQAARASFAFFARDPHDLARDGARFALTPTEITLLNPNTGTCPIFRSRRDAELTIAIYERVPILVRHSSEGGSPWGASFLRMVDMSNDSATFRTRTELLRDGWALQGNWFRRGNESMAPLYEAKMVHLFEHRWATYDGEEARPLTQAEREDRAFSAQPRYWVPGKTVTDRLGCDSEPWLLGFRDITGTEKIRTMICTPLPRAAIGNKLPLLRASSSPDLLLANLSSLVFDYVTRQKVGGTSLNFFIVEQLPVLDPAAFESPCPWRPLQLARWIRDRTIELVYTSDDMADVAAGLDDYRGPFVWQSERRQMLRAELDAAFFHLYGLGRTDTEYVLSTFPIANRNDPELTPRILREYDAMQQAIDTGIPYESPLDPPPGAGRRHF